MTKISADVAALAGKPKVVSFGLVRDKDGNPKIDDTENLHPAIKMMLTPKECDHLNITITEEDKKILATMERVD